MVIAWDVLNSPETLFELAGGEFHFEVGWGGGSKARSYPDAPGCDESLQFAAVLPM